MKQIIDMVENEKQQAIT